MTDPKNKVEPQGKAENQKRNEIDFTDNHKQEQDDQKKNDEVDDVGGDLAGNAAGNTDGEDH